MHNWEDVPFSLADDFFLIGLDGRTNRPRLHAKAMGLGVAAALMAELVLSNYIQIHQNRILVASRHYAPEAREHADMLSAIIAEPQHELPVWLTFFAQTSVDIVQERLVAHRFMHVESRGVLRSKQTYVPVDPMSVEWRSLRIARLISKRDIRTWEDLSIIGLISLLYGIIEGPHSGWGSAIVVGSFVVAVATLTAFVFWERHTDHPLLDITFKAMELDFFAAVVARPPALASPVSTF